MTILDQVNDRTFDGDLTEEAVTKLKEIVKDKLKEYMGDYTDDTLVEYVIVLLRNGRRKEEAKNELKIFLGEHSDSFVAWLWDYLNEYFSSNVEKTIVKSEEKVDSESDKSCRSRQWGSKASSNVNEVPPLLSSEVHKVHSYEKKDRKHRHDKRSPSPESLSSHRKRSKTDEQREAKPVSCRLLQSAFRDALAAPKTLNGSSKPLSKRLRSVVAASTEDSSDPDHDTVRKIQSVGKAVNPMETVLKAIAEAAEDVKTTKTGRSVFDRISLPTGFSETADEMMTTEVFSGNGERRNQETYAHRNDNNGLQSIASLGNRISNPNSLQHRLVDVPNTVKEMHYQNHLTEVATKPKTSNFSSRLVSTEAITTQPSTEKANGNIKPVANAKEDSPSKKSVPGTSSTIRPLEDASSRTIFVANVHFGATKDSLSRHFNKFGDVLKAIIVTDPATGQPSGSAYIEFTRKESAENALSLDGTSFMSRILKIVKGNNGQQQQEAAASMAWPRGVGRFTITRASYYQRGVVGAYRGRSVVRGGARSMQWKRDSGETGNNTVVAPTPRSLTYVRAESKPDGNATVEE